MTYGSKKIIVSLAVVIILLLGIGASYLLLKGDAQVRIKKEEGKPSPSVISTAPDTLSISDLKNVTIPDFTHEDEDQNISLSDYTFVGTTGIEGSKNEIRLQTEITLLAQEGSYAVGDVNGDGLSDIVAVINWSGGGSGYFYELAVFLNKNGKPQYTASTFLGDRIKINAISIKDDHTISADIITQGPDEPLCCGTMKKVITYQFTGDNRLIELR